MPTAGDIAIDAKSVVALPPYRATSAWYSELRAVSPSHGPENIGFPLKQRGVAKAERAKLVGERSSWFILPGYGERYPRQLSGAAAARALARAIVFKPRLLLMDEPRGRLDKAAPRELQLRCAACMPISASPSSNVTHDRKKRSPCRIASPS